MKSPLNTYQRRFAENRVASSESFLSPSLAEALRRAALASTENHKTETGIIDFVCGLYLQYRTEVTIYFRGDFSALVSRHFPVHRFGHEGLIPKAMLDQMKSGGEGAEAMASFTLKYTDALR